MGWGGGHQHHLEAHTAGSLFVLGFGARCYYRTGLSVSTSDDGIPKNRQ